MGRWGIRAARVKALHENATLKDKEHFIRVVANHRMTICRTCTWLEAKTCKACGCDVTEKTRTMHTICGAVSKGKNPKWTNELSKADGDKFHKNI